MPKSLVFCQFVACAINHITCNIPRIRDDDRWRNIDNAQVVENQNCINGHDHYEDAIFRLETFLKQKRWRNEITHLKETCQRNLLSQ